MANKRKRQKPKEKTAQKLPIVSTSQEEYLGEISPNAGVYIKGAQESLIALFKSREQTGAWSDQESETQLESLAYKTAEALDTFFRFYILRPDFYPREQLGGAKALGLLCQDFRDWISLVKKNGFIPFPYVYTSDPGQSTEFASFAIGFCRNAYQFLDTHNLLNSSLRNDISTLVSLAIKFLDESHLQNKDGMSWSVCEKPYCEGQERTDVYSTSRVVIALCSAQAYREMFDAMKTEERKFTRRAIDDGCQWMLKAIDKTIFQEYQDGGQRELGISISALEAMAASLPNEAISEKQRKRVEAVITTLLSTAKNKTELLTQGFFIRAQTQNKPPFYHDPRWTWSSPALIGMASIHELIKNLAGIETVEREYYDLLSRLHTKVWAARDSDTALWVVDNFGIGDTYRGIISTLLYSLYGRPRIFTVTEGQIRAAIQDSVISEAVFHAVLRAMDRVQDDLPRNMNSIFTEEQN